MCMRLVASDIDGTLMNHENKFSQNTISTINRLLDSGVQFVLATGRGPELIPAPLKTIEGIRYAIIENGAGIWDMREEKFLYRKKLPLHAASQMLQLLDGMGYPEVFVKGRCYVDRNLVMGIPDDFHDQNFVKYIRSNHERVEHLSEQKTLLEEAEKINFFYLSSREEEKLRTWLTAQKKYAVTSSMTGNIEIQSKEENKGKALQMLCDLLEIQMSDVIAFGDGNNDIEMLQVAGEGVAMGNAPVEVQQAADYVTGSNDEDGVASYFGEFAQENF